MKIEYCFQGCLDKLKPFLELCTLYNVSSNEVAYIGDGLIDIPIMEKVDVAITVPHAHPMVKSLAVYETQACGGRGVLREVVELILNGQDRYSKILHDMRKNIYKA